MTQASDAKTPKAPRRWGRWIGLSILGLIVLAIGGHAVWGWWQEKKLGEEVAALRAKGEPAVPEDFKSASVLESDNAAAVLRNAAASIDQSSKALERFGWIALELPLNEKEMVIVGPALGENKNALMLARKARTMRGVDWKIPLTSPLMFQDESALKGLDDLSQLLLAAGLLAHQDGRDAEAVECAMDLIRQAQAIEHAPARTAHLLALKTWHRAIDLLTQVTADLRVGDLGVSVAAVRELINKLLDELELREGFLRAMQFERARNVDTAKAIKDGTLSGSQNTPRSEFAMSGYLYRPILMRDARVMLAHGTILLEASKAGDFLTYRQRLTKGAELSDLIDRNRKWHPLAAVALPLDQGLAWDGRQYRLLAERRMLAVALALRLYAVEHAGKLPAKAEELVPNFLVQIPVDPYSKEGNALGYAGDEKRPIVYSVGENGTDEGGSEKPLRTIAIAYRWEQQDAVLHLAKQPRQRRSFYDHDGTYLEDDGAAAEKGNQNGQ